MCCNQGMPPLLLNFIKIPTAACATRCIHLYARQYYYGAVLYQNGNNRSIQLACVFFIPQHNMDIFHVSSYPSKIFLPLFFFQQVPTLYKRPCIILLWKSVKLKLAIHPFCHNFAMKGSYITAQKTSSNQVTVHIQPSCGGHPQTYVLTTTACY